MRADFVTAEQGRDLGFVTEVVQRDDLLDAAVSLANEIARLDPLVAQMIKRSVNRAQDRMGFRDQMLAAHSNYMMLNLGGSVQPKDDVGNVMRLPGVERSLRDAASG